MVVEVLSGVITDLHGDKHQTGGRLVKPSTEQQLWREECHWSCSEMPLQEQFFRFVSCIAKPPNTVLL